ncbi:MAG: RNA polymerase sigma factor [Roseateles asaccharophilus]|uniref:RNA polymerase sigma factor n=1 Tax=Roseateles asaccharophilus TaxID=582607 RepID=UPI00391D92A1
MSAPAQAIALVQALETVLRQDRGRMMAALTHRLGSVQRAEDALQEASLSAMSHWARDGLRESPQGWLIRVAFRKALDQLRTEGRDGEREAAVQQLQDLLGHEEPESIPDERLRLIFTCCHPALELKSRVALTLRTVCGLSTGEIARLFLDQEATMGQRLSRAKTKIARAGIAYAVPAPEHWEARLQAVLTTVYLIFTTGYNAAADEARDLCGEALFLARLLDALCPAQPEIEGALALMLLTEARRAARVSACGATVPPAEQDRRLWHREAEAEGRHRLEAALRRKRAGPFQIKAAISACQMAEPGPDWPQILCLYTALLPLEPTPVVRVNHAVAMAENGLLAAALATLNALQETLADFQPLHAARAAVLAMAGQTDAAWRAYEQAIALASHECDKRFLAARAARLR